jgi:hypothetical protein
LDPGSCPFGFVWLDRYAAVGSNLTESLQIAEDAHASQNSIGSDGSAQPEPAPQSVLVAKVETSLAERRRRMSCWACWDTLKRDGHVIAENEG